MCGSDLKSLNARRAKMSDFARKSFRHCIKVFYRQQANLDLTKTLYACRKFSNNTLKTVISILHVPLYTVGFCCCCFLNPINWSTRILSVSFLGLYIDVGS